MEEMAGRKTRNVGGKGSKNRSDGYVLVKEGGVLIVSGPPL